MYNYEDYTYLSKEIKQLFIPEFYHIVVLKYPF
jgi:hypothetical protein